MQHCSLLGLRLGQSTAVKSQRLVLSCTDFMARSKQQARKGKASHNKAQKQHHGRGNWGKKQNTGEWDQDTGVRGNYALSVRENKDFETYYKEQNIVPAEEWDEFMQKLKENLPSTFRIAGNSSEKKEMLKIIKGSYLNNLLKFEALGREIEPPKSLPWYPEEVAWQVNLDRKFIRQSEVLKKFHQFLVQETESGNLSRQEAVSMIPPIVLDVKPHHKVLDMCAAPGSKTAQLIEMLHADESQAVPDGFVVANDSDNKRCYLMVHQVRRMQSPCFIVINHDASMLPSFKVPSPNSDRPVSLKFDRILCDVPCSGDGTMRKNYDAWKKWHTAIGHNLHNLQCRILNRGLELLEVGGRIVYSTCSFNPVENEAVICRMLQKAEGAVQLVDVSDGLPGLKRETGLCSWKVMARSGTFYEKYEDLPEGLQTQIRPSVFPPTPTEADKLNLHRCMRVLPHRQNTGGFFIAVLEKTKEVPWVQYKSWGDDPEGEDGANGGKEDSDKPGDKRKHENTGHGPSSKRHKKLYGYKEDPFIFLEEDDPIWPGIQEFYNIAPEFNMNQLLVRSKEGKKKHLYFASKMIRELVRMNEDRFKFINLGLKVLTRSTSRFVECDFRIVQDGLSTICPYIRNRKVSITKEDLVVILSQENPYLSKLSDKTKTDLESLEQGGLVYVYTPDENPDSPQCHIEVCGWLGKVSCRCFLPQNERAHFLRLCGHELKTKDEVMAEKEAKNGESSSGVGQESLEGNQEVNQEIKNQEMDQDVKEEVKGEVREGEDLDEGESISVTEVSQPADVRPKSVQDEVGKSVEEVEEVSADISNIQTHSDADCEKTNTAKGEAMNTKPVSENTEKCREEKSTEIRPECPSDLK